MINLYLETMTIGEKFMMSGEMLLRGMGTVFMVLILLWGIFAFSGRIFAGTGKKASEIKPESTPIQAAEPVTVPEETAASDDDGALVAAITAAIEAYRTENGINNTAFRVVSFRQKKSAGGWIGNDNQ